MIYKFKPYYPTPVLINHLNIGGQNSDGEKIGVMGEYHFVRDSRIFDIASFAK